MENLYNIQSQCKHYIRNCKIQSPCCNMWFGCRLCHDELVQKQQLQSQIGQNNNHFDLESQQFLQKSHCNVEKMDRFNIKYILCKNCNNIQKPEKQCNKCNKEFASYFCSICNLYSSDKSKDIYHCEKCGICVKGKKEEKFHCDICGICLPNRKLNNHVCIKDALDRECPICLNNMKFSVETCVKFKNCGHWIHQECFKSYIKEKINKCPLCQQVILKQKKEDIEATDIIVQQATMQIMQNTNENNRQYQKIICNQCNKISPNVLETYTNYYKCQNSECGCYLTKLI